MKSACTSSVPLPDIELGALTVAVVPLARNTYGAVIDTVPAPSTVLVGTADVPSGTAASTEVLMTTLRDRSSETLPLNSTGTGEYLVWESLSPATGPIAKFAMPESLRRSTAKCRSPGDASI